MTTEKQMDTGPAIAVLLLLPFAMMWVGYVASKLWEWFVVPQFGARPLSVAVAIGLSTLIGLWFKPWRKPKGEGPTTWASLFSDVVLTIAFPAVSLLFGYVASRFM